jgi:hypothetical protein
MTLLPSIRTVTACCLIVLLVLAFAHPLQAAEKAPDPLFAGWISKYFSGLATRSRVIQVAAVGMCTALLILMKKFDGAEPRR